MFGDDEEKKENRGFKTTLSGKDAKDARTKTTVSLRKKKRHNNMMRKRGMVKEKSLAFDKVKKQLTQSFSKMIEASSAEEKALHMKMIRMLLVSHAEESREQWLERLKFLDAKYEKKPVFVHLVNMLDIDNNALRSEIMLTFGNAFFPKSDLWIIQLVNAGLFKKARDILDKCKDVAVVDNTLYVLANGVSSIKGLNNKLLYDGILLVLRRFLYPMNGRKFEPMTHQICVTVMWLLRNICRCKPRANPKYTEEILVFLWDGFRYAHSQKKKDDSTLDILRNVVHAMTAATDNCDEEKSVDNFWKYMVASGKPGASSDPQNKPPVKLHQRGRILMDMVRLDYPILRLHAITTLGNMGSVTKDYYLYTLCQHNIISFFEQALTKILSDIRKGRQPHIQHETLKILIWSIGNFAIARDPVCMGIKDNKPFFRTIPEMVMRPKGLFDALVDYIPNMNHVEKTEMVWLAHNLMLLPSGIIHMPSHPPRKDSGPKERRHCMIYLEQYHIWRKILMGPFMEKMVPALISLPPDAGSNFIGVLARTVEEISINTDGSPDKNQFAKFLMQKEAWLSIERLMVRLDELDLEDELLKIDNKHDPRLNKASYLLDIIRGEEEEVVSDTPPDDFDF